MSSVHSTCTGVQLWGYGAGAGRAGLCLQGSSVPVPMNEGIEGQTIPPAGGEILDVYLGVTGSGEGEQRERWKSQEGRREGGCGRMDEETDG